RDGLSRLTEFEGRVRAAVDPRVRQHGRQPRLLHVFVLKRGKNEGAAGALQLHVREERGELDDRGSPLLRDACPASIGTIELAISPPISRSGEAGAGSP